MTAVTGMSLAEARRLALAAQGFGHWRQGAGDGADAVRSVAERVHVLQIDSVNVLTRSHYLPTFSRHGPYDRAMVDELAYERHELFEYPAHAASLVPVSLHHLFRWRMEVFGHDHRWVGGASDAVLQSLVDQVAERGPLAASDLASQGPRRTGAWASTPGRVALGWLHSAGRLAVAGRGKGFQALYDLPERVIPEEVLHVPTPRPDDAKRELLCLAAGALGVATAKELAEYFHIGHGPSRISESVAPVPATKPTTLVNELVSEGRLAKVTVEGWRQPAFAVPGAVPPADVEACAVLTPFDSLVWERARTARLFDFDYKLELYVPEPKRRYGYFVLPFLLGDELVARVDVRIGDQNGALAVLGSFVEPGCDGGRVARALASELACLAAWLGAPAIDVHPRGDLAAELTRAIG